MIHHVEYTFKNICSIQYPPQNMWEYLSTLLEATWNDGFFSEIAMEIHGVLVRKWSKHGVVFLCICMYIYISYTVMSSED